MSNRAIISFASRGRENYPLGLIRNIHETRKHYKGGLFYYCNELAGQEIDGTIIKSVPQDMPSHKETPYAFKPYLFKKIYDEGYTQIIWTDSTIVMERNPDPIFNLMAKRGVVAFHNLGHDLNPWISDKAVANIGLNRDENPKQIMACVVGFDLSTPIGLEIFNKWLELSQDGESFNNNPGTYQGFKAHRHDQACLSALLHIYKVELLPYGVLVYEPHNITKEFGTDIYFTNKAIE